MWLDTYPEDFRDSPNYTCLHELEKFAREYAPGTGIGRKVREKLEAFHQEDVEYAGTGRLNLLLEKLLLSCSSAANLDSSEI